MGGGLRKNSSRLPIDVTPVSLRERNAGTVMRREHESVCGDHPEVVGKEGQRVGYLGKGANCSSESSENPQRTDAL